jgi:hypothetical protein
VLAARGRSLGSAAVAVVPAALRAYPLVLPKKSAFVAFLQASLQTGHTDALSHLAKQGFEVDRSQTLAAGKILNF